MDTDAHSDNEFPTVENTSFASAGGTFFPGSQGFIINNNVFKNVTRTTTLETPPNIHTITMGDIELRSQLHVKDSDEWRFDEHTGTVHRECRRGSARRVYSAKIGDRKTDMTVVMFEGDGAEQKWQQNIATYSGLRHPNILQIYGVASSGSIHATVFHGDLMQVEDFCRLHAHPPFCKHISGFLEYGHVITPLLDNIDDFRCNSSVYEDLLIYSPVVTSSQSADAYFTWRFGQYMCFAEYRLWIQPSTGTISAELGNSHTSWSWWWTNDMTIQNPALPLNAPNADTLATACMSLDVYHHTYCLRLSHPVGLAYLTTFTTVTLGAMVSVPLTCQAVSCMDASEPVGRPHLENFVKLASLEEIEVWDGDGWRCDGVIMANGWTRCPTHSVKSSSSISLSFRVRDQDFAGWISQANHIFKRLHISSSFCDYVLIDTLEIDLWIRQITVNTPTGYLFLCPESHFRTGPASFAWPECPAYWSLDPSGAERLSTEEATHLGFPPFEFESEVAGVYWEDEVYASLRQFHAGKGFDPDSPDVARHLGHALYRLSSDEPTDVDVEAHMAESPAMTDAHASDADLSPGTSASIQEEIPPVSRTFKLLMNL